MSEGGGGVWTGRELSVEELYCKRPIQCSGVFQNIDPHAPRRVCTPRHWWGVNSLEDARHCSVLYLCKYFVELSIAEGKGGKEGLTKEKGGQRNEGNY